MALAILEALIGAIRFRKEAEYLVAH